VSLQSFRPLLSLALYLCGLGWPMQARPQAVSVQAVKAGFVYNFAKFTDWPPGPSTSAGAATGGQAQLCLLGPDPQGAVAATVGGKTLQGREITVRSKVRLEDLSDCTILYLTDVDERRQAEALRAVRGAPVLTVGDADGFVDAGGMIGLLTVGDRIQFEIQSDLAAAAGLRISSQLLRLARTVRGRP
jgi:hypothetical protein